MPGSRPRQHWLWAVCLSCLIQPLMEVLFAVESKDELQQIVWNTRDFLSSWLMGRAKRQNNPLTSAI